MALLETKFPPYVPFGSRNLFLTTPRLRGTDVAIFQKLYNQLLKVTNPPQGPIGTPIVEDGSYGPGSRQAAINVQSYFGLSVDGIVGPQTFFAFGQGVRGQVTYGGPAFASRNLSPGSTGGDVIVLQNRLNCFRYHTQVGGPADGVFGPKTGAAVIQFKMDAIAHGDTGLAINDVVGGGAFDAFFIYTFAGGRGIFTGRNGLDVAFIQTFLKNQGLYSGFIDGYYGAKSKAAVIAFQTASGISADGVVGQRTYFAIGKVNNVAAPSPFPIIPV